MSVDFGSTCGSARDRVLNLLTDLAWHRHSEIERVGGNRYCARLLELRRLGFQIETRKVDDCGKAYRLTSLVRGEPQRKLVKVYLEEQDADLIASGFGYTGTAQTAVADALWSFRANRARL